MLTFAEELLLLSHDEKTGQFYNISDAMPALAGAVLMELALQDRIDTDLDKLIVVDATPTGEPVLDGILAQMVTEPGTHSTEDWLDFVKHSGQEIHDAALQRLIERGVLRREENRVLWVFGTRRYPMVENHEQQEVKLRIAALLDKPSRRRRPVQVDYVGFEVPDQFLVGYGLDYEEDYRNLPDVCILEG